MNLMAKLFRRLLMGASTGAVSTAGRVDLAFQVPVARAPSRMRLTKTMGSGVTLRAGTLTGMVPYTFLYIIPIEAPCYAARIGFLNPYNVNMTVTTARFYPTDTYSGAAAAQVTGNVAVTMTGGGASAPIYFDNAGADLPIINTAGTLRNITMAANAGNGGNAAVGSAVTWSDFVPVTSSARADGALQHLLAVSITVSTADFSSGGANFTAFDADATANRGRLTYCLGASNNEVDYADNLPGTNWKSFGNPAFGPLFALQYVTDRPGIQVVLNGDSLPVAPSNDGYSSPLQRAAWDLSTPALPIEVASLAWGAQTSAVYDPLLRLNAEALRPSIIALSPNSQNDPGNLTAASAQMLMAKAMANADTLKSLYGTVPIFNSAGCQPSISGNSALIAGFTDIQARMVSSGIPMINAPSLIGNVAGGAPWDYLAGFSDDNAHGNFAAAEALVPQATAALRQLVGQ